MIGSRKKAQAHHLKARQPVSSLPAVEQLESREVLSAATFNVAAHIIQSAENFGNFVAGDYLRFLRRPADTAGFDTFVGALEGEVAPEAVEAAFVGSTEYILKHGNNPTQWLVGVYNDVLGRAPDSAGLNHWLSRMAVGETAFQVALEIINSTERRTQVIVQDYEAFLGRAPEAGGVSFWLSQMQLGLNRAGLADSIVGSEEYFLRHGRNNTDFVVGVYEDVLHRAPSTTELDFWLSQLPPS
jgi:hypothetical protein